MHAGEALGGLGRVAVIDRHGGARRVLRAIGELAAAGSAEASVAIHAPEHRSAAFVREADEAVELGPSLEDALRAARATSAWLGPASLEERAVFAEACARAGVVPLGPPAAALRRLLGPRAIPELAAELDVAHEDPEARDGRARIIEVVVACDRAGIARAIGTADASLSAGDVAIIAESPAPGLERVEEPARALAERALLAIGWRGVGVVRLAVSPGTSRLALLAVDAFARSAPALEEATGVDLVRLALRLAAGAAAGAVRAVAERHAMAARIQARDPEGDAARSGRVELMRLPSGPGVRAHPALAEGDDAIPGAVLATVIAVADERGEAAARLERALSESDVLVRGSATSRAWLRGLLSRPEVRSGEAGRGFLEGLLRRDEELVQRNPEVALLAAAIEAYDSELEIERARFVAEARRGRPRVGSSAGRNVELRWHGRRHRFEVRQTGPDQYRVTAARGDAADVRVDRLDGAERRLRCFGRRWRILSAVEGLRHLVEVDGVPHAIRRDPAGIVASPMPAVVVAIAVAPGQRVEAGDPVARIESMKVEMVVTAPAAGTVREVLTVANAQVDAGAPLVRIDPPGEEAAQDVAARLPERTGPAPEPEAPRALYLGAVEALRALALGFDLSAPESRRLAASWRELAAAVPLEDAEVLRAEEQAVQAFADVQSLYARARPAEGDPDARPPLEELWRYLHEPESHGEGLSPSFVEALRRALSHYGLSLDEPGRALEIALLRMQKAYERAAEQLPPVLAIVDRRLAGEGVPPGGSAGSRALLDALAKIGQERFPSLADLARELRYRRFDQPALEEVRRASYVAAEADLARLADAQGAEREAIVERLVECPHPLATLLVSRTAAAPPALRPRLVETLLRRYYRARPLAPAVAHEADGVPGVVVDYAHAGEQFRIAACFARAAEADRAARQVARLAADAPRDRAVACELYLWNEGAPLAKDAQATALGAAIAAAGFTRPVRRVSVVVACGGRGLGRQASQQHFTFAGGDTFTEDRRYRGIHPMLFRRMQLVRLEKFDLERLPSAEDVFLYRGVAQGNPKDERLFAAAEVRDLTPVRDASGRVVQLPQLERVLHEALAGMRRFQSERAPHERLEWNRVLLTVAPPLRLSREEVRGLAERLAPATQGLGLEMVLIDVRIPDPKTGELVEKLLRVIAGDRGGVSLRWDAPTDRPLEPLGEYQQRVVQLRRRGLVHPFEIVRQLAPEQPQLDVPRGTFIEHDLDASGEALVPVQRAPGKNAANMVVGVVTSFTERYPEGMKRVVLLGDPSRAMGSLAEPECRRIAAAIALAEKLGVPLEWFAISAGAKISMESGVENMDWISIVLRRIVEFTQRGGEINVVVTGINVGAQPYWNAEATMLMHTRGILVMTPGSAMVLTGKEALEYSGSVSGEDNPSIGGYDRIMGPNGQAQYRAASVADAVKLLFRHYDHTYVAPGERFPRRARTRDPADRDVRTFPHGPAGGAGFETVGDVFSAEKNPDRKKPFDIRRVMAACVDQDHATLERWHDLRGGDTAVVWDAHLGGRPVCLIGIESRPLPRLEFVPADGPEIWSAGTLFPQSSKKIARALNSASGNRPVVVLANLSGFDGSPESMRRLQLEHGAEIGRAVVNFRGPIVFCVVSRYHGGAFVVFSKTLREDIEVAAVEGARASVIGGAPAAAVVFAREVETRTRKDPRVAEAEKAATAGGAARRRLEELVTAVRSEKVGEVAEEFDAIHTVERALKMGSVDRIISARDLRPYLVEAVERRIAGAGDR